MTVHEPLGLTGDVNTVYLADGKLVRLVGAFGPSELPDLRRALLMPFTEECRDVVVDAGEVVDVTDEAVALLIAARVWADANGRRFLMSRIAPVLVATLAELDMSDVLPTLSDLASSAVPLPEPLAALPLQRTATD